MLEKNGKSMLLCIDYILKKNGYDTFLIRNKIIDKMLSTCENPHDILHKLKIEYTMDCIPVKEYTILFDNNICYVVVDISKEIYKLWDASTAKTTEIKISDAKKFHSIYIKNIDGNLIKLFSKKRISVYYMKNIFNNLISFISIIALTIIVNLMVFLLGILIEIIIDNIVPVNGINIFSYLMIVILLIIFIIYVLLIVQNKIISKVYKKKIEFKIYIITILISLAVLFLYYVLNYPYISYIILNIIFIFILSILEFSILNHKLSCNDKIINRISNFNRIVVFLSFFWFLYLLFVGFMNDSLSRGSIYASLIIYSYLLYKIKDLVIVWNGLLKEKCEIFDEYYQSQRDMLINKLCKVSFSELKVEFKSENDKDLWIMKEGSINEIVFNNGSGKTYFSKILTGTVVDDKYEIYYDEYPISEIDSSVLLKNCAVINNLNYSQMDYIDDVNISYDKYLKSDIEYVYKTLNINKNLNEKNNIGCEYIREKDLFLQYLAKIILSNKHILIFDNILCRFDTELINRIKEISKNLNLISIVLENKDQTDCKFDNVYNMIEF